MKRELLQVTFELGVGIGHQRALLRSMLADPATVEAFRQREWVRRYRSQCRVERGDQVVVPEGWPTGTDMESVLREEYRDTFAQIAKAYEDMGVKMPPLSE